jgi:hypothetical protein
VIKLKIRSDFVTNSSSSSFICEICGEVASGWDMAISEAEMYECVNGHVFCWEEALEKPTKTEMIKMILENEWNKDRWDRTIDDYRTFTEEELLEADDDYLFDVFCCEEEGGYGVPECVCPICQFIEYSEDDLSAYLLKEYEIPRDEVFAEVKALNKRRKKLYESEYIAYVCKKFDLNPTEIVASWKEKFGTYSEFEKWLR